MSLRLRCPECGSSVRLPDSRRDRRNYCPRCDAELPRASRDQGSGNSGAVIALVLALVFAGGIAVLGCGAALWLLMPAKNPPVAQAPAPQAAPDDGGVRIAPPDPEPGERLAPRMPDVGDPPTMKGDAPFVPGKGALGPGAREPELRRPPVRELKLPPLPAAVEIKPAPVAAPTELKLPDTADKAVVGGGGRYLVLHFPKQRKLGIFDANTAKVSPYIDLPEDKIHFTAGMNKLLVLLPSAGMIRRYDLTTGQLEVTRPFTVRGVTAFAMGHSSAGPLVVRGDNAAKLYDITSFAEIPLPDPPGDERLGRPIDPPQGTRSLPFDGGDVWPAGNGRVFGNTGNYGMPNGVKVVSMEGGKVTERREHVGTWFVQPSPDGKFVFSGGHKPVTVDLKASPDLVESGLQGSGHASNMYLPAHHGPYYLGLGQKAEPGARPGSAPKNEIRIFLYGLSQPLVRIPAEGPNNVAGGGADWGVLSNLPTIINLIPRANLLVIRGSDRLRLIPVDLEKELEKSGADFLLVTTAPPASYKAGTEFRYAVKARSKGGRVEFKLEAGPDGMKVASDGTVTWKVPADHKEQVTVILSLKDQGGKEAFHNFTLVPEGDAPPKGADAAPANRPEAQRPAARPGIRVPPTPARPQIKPPALTERKSVPMPDTAERAIPAGGGRFLVCHFPKLRKVGFFDINEMKFVRFIDLAEDKPLMTAGMNKLVVYLPSAKLIQRYDLATGNREPNKVLDVPDVKAIAVGSASAGPLVVAAAGGGRLFDLDTLGEMELPKEEVRDREPPPGPRRLPFTGDKLWASANGRLFIGSGAYNSGAIALDGNQVTVKPGFGEAWVYAQPSADGKYVFRAGTGAVTADAKKALDVVYSGTEGGGHAGYFFLPAVDGPFYFHVHFAGGGLGAHDPKFAKDPRRAVTVYMYGLDTPLARVLDVQDVRDWNSFNQAGVPFSEHIHLIPRAKAMVTVGPSGDRLTFIPLDLNQALDEAGIDFLLITSSPPGTFCPGNELKYPIRVRSRAGGLKYTLESGPDGMKVGDDGVLTWKVPAKIDESEVAVIVGVKDAAGKEAFHNFRLTRSDTPEPYQPDPAPEPVKAAPARGQKSDGPRVPYKLQPALPAPEIAAPEIADRTEVRIADRFDRVVTGGGGRFLVLHAATARKAMIFDVAAGAVARTIDLGDERAVIAAGMAQLLVYRPSDNSIEKFALATGSSEGKKPIPTRGVTEMVMGSASAGPLFVRSAEHAELYDVESLTMMELPDSEGFPFAQGPVWASADGRAFGNTLTRPTGSFVRVAVLWPDRIRVSSVSLSARYAVPVGSSKVFVGGYGELTTELQPEPNHGRPVNEGSDPAYHFLPAGGAYFLVLHTGVRAPPYLRGLKETQNGVSVWHRDQRRAVATVDGVAEMTADLRDNPALPSLVHFHPEMRVLVTVPPSNDRLVLYPVMLDGASYPKKPAIAWRLPELPPPAEFKAGVVKERIAYNMPARITKVAVGGGGRYLVYQIDPHKLAVFDLNEAKIVREISTNHPILSYAAGMARLVLTEQTSSGSILRRYDIATGKLEQSVAPSGERETLVMGSASAGPVLAVGRTGAVFYDLATLAPMQLSEKSLNTTRLQPSRLSAAPDGRNFVAQTYRTSGTTHPVLISLTGDGARVTTANPMAMSSAEFSADGRHLLIGSQGIFTPELRKAADVIWSPDKPSDTGHYGMVFAPAADGPYYLQLHLGARGPDDKFAEDPQYGVSIFKYGKDKPNGRLPSVVGPTRVGDNFISVLKPSGAYHLVASAKLLVAVDPAMSKLHLIPLDPENIPPMADPDPVPPGPKTPAKKTTPKRRPGDNGPPQAAPTTGTRPFKLAPLPEPLPISPVTESKTAKIEIENVAGSMSPVVVRLGGGGRFLLIQWHSQKIDVFDLNEAKVVRRIELGDGFYSHWSAGMTKLVVSNQDLRGLRRFDLLTGKEELKKEYPEQVYVEAMGSATDGPVLCHTPRGLRFVDLETLEVMDLAGPDLSGPEYANKTFWASPDGRAYGMGVKGVPSAAGAGPQFATVTLSVGAAGAKKTVGQFPVLYAVPDPTARYVFAGGHGVYDMNFGKTKDAVRSEDPAPTEPPAYLYLPALDGPFYFRYVPQGTALPPGRPGGGPEPAEGGVTIYAYGQSKPVARIADVDPIGRRIDPFSLLRLPAHMLLIPRAKVLVVFQPQAREMTIRLIPVDLEAEMAKSGVEVPWVTSSPPRSFKTGEQLRYPLKVVSKAGGLKYVLDGAAAGMTVSADGVFTWMPPADAPGEVRVLVRVKDAKGGESVHAFPLTRQ